jgi:hypothetical protein
MDTHTTPSRADEESNSHPYGAMSYGVGVTTTSAPADSAALPTTRSRGRRREAYPEWGSSQSGKSHGSVGSVGSAPPVDRSRRQAKVQGAGRRPAGAHSPRAIGSGAMGDGDRPASDGDRSGRPRRGGRRAWIVVALLVAILSPSAWSYGATLAAPGNVPLTVRSVEWLRDHHAKWLVNDVENFWYNHHKPKKGGLPKIALGRLAPPGAPTAVAPSTAPGTPGPRVKHLPAPPAIQAIVASPLPGEGQWQPLGQPVNGVPAMYSAYLRPDPVYTSLVTAVAWMDPSLVKAVLYAGVQEPGGSGWRYQAPVAAADRSGLLAAFNSGFKLSDSRGGYFAEGRTVRPLKPGGATLAIRADGTPTVGQWGRDVQMGPDIAFARQNLSLIVDNGQPVPDIDQGGLSKWGATLGNKVLVWRSGVGVTANGALVYAGGNDLSAGSLARVMARAGAVRAMELDINSEWVDFFSYGPAAAGQPAANLSVTKLLPDMRASLNRYFGANSRDFIAIFRR